VPSMMVVYLGVMIPLLVAICAWAYWSSDKALRWCAAQDKGVDQAPSFGDSDRGDSPNPGETDGFADLPRGPLTQRNDLLQRLHETAIAEGQLVTLLLRREVIDGEHDAERGSQMLVSTALAGTIVGLCVTLWGLSDALAKAVGTGVPEIMQAVGTPLGHLPYMFVPTAVGLFLALLAQHRQYQVDSCLQTTWTRIDQATIGTLIPHYFGESTRTAQAQAIEKLHHASDLFADAGTQIQGAMSGIERSLEQISDLNQTKWAQHLMEAADQFRGHVEASSENLEKASKEIGAALGEIPASTSALSEASLSLTDATRKVSKATKQTAAALEAVGGTLEPLAELPESVNRFTGSVDGLGEGLGKLAPSVDALRVLLSDWTTEQQKWLREAVEAVDRLDNTMKPMIEEARGLHEETKASRAQTLGALQGVRDNLDQAGTKLRDIISAHDNTLLGLPHNVEEAIRAGHEAWVVEAGSRFDQNEKLFVQLAKLADQLGTCRSAFNAAAELARDVTGPGKELVESSKAALLELRESVKQLHNTVVREDEWTQPETWRDMLVQHVRDLQRGLAPLSALEGLPTTVAGLSHEIRALKMEIDRLRLPSIPQRIMDWLRGRSRGSSGPPGFRGR